MGWVRSIGIPRGLNSMVPQERSTSFPASDHEPKRRGLRKLKTGVTGFFLERVRTHRWSIFSIAPTTTFVKLVMRELEHPRRALMEDRQGGNQYQWEKFMSQRFLQPTMQCRKYRWSENAHACTLRTCIVFTQFWIAQAFFPTARSWHGAIGPSKTRDRFIRRKH